MDHHMSLFEKWRRLDGERTDLTGENKGFREVHRQRLKSWISSRRLKTKWKRIATFDIAKTKEYRVKCAEVKEKLREMDAECQSWVDSVRRNMDAMIEEKSPLRSDVKARNERHQRHLAELSSSLSSLRESLDPLRDARSASTTKESELTAIETQLTDDELRIYNSDEQRQRRERRRERLDATKSRLRTENCELESYLNWADEEGYRLDDDATPMTNSVNRHPEQQEQSTLDTGERKAGTDRTLSNENAIASSPMRTVDRKIPSSNLDANLNKQRRVNYRLGAPPPKSILKNVKKKASSTVNGGSSMRRPTSAVRQAPSSSRKITEFMAKTKASSQKTKVPSKQQRPSTAERRTALATLNRTAGTPMAQFDQVVNACMQTPDAVRRRRLHGSPVGDHTAKQKKVVFVL